MMFRASLLATAALANDPNPYFFNLTATGDDLTKPVVNEEGMDYCVALGPGSEPIKFSSNAPQFCLVVSGETTERCCTPSHDSYIKTSMDDLWPRECAGEEQPELEIMACFSCAKEQPQFTKHFTAAEKAKDPLGKKGIIRVCESVLRGIYGADDRAELE